MSSRIVPALVSSAVLAVLTPAGAHAASDHGDAVRTAETGISAQAYAAQSDGPAILYINGCFSSGCRVTGGSGSSSQTNTSSLLKGDASVQPYAQGQAHFDQVVSCVRDIFEPFGISVTDVDPGAVPHFESIVGGSTPESLGFPSQIGGVAPTSCGVIPNAISFVFPTRLDGSVRETCETIAHEAAHTWGLEHSYMCEDTMTYLSGCGAKEFEDADVMSGESQPRACQCGGTTQNSYRKLVDLFGVANPTPPTVQLMSPTPGSRVDPGFTVIAQASDDTEVRLVELWIDRQRV
ncbi:MAG: hypothetical protein KJO07_14195, partial [Deltaproteobacteria bacterium]|nr:hypothetical protein [Deltaproteobacteria bacterium]